MLVGALEVGGAELDIVRNFPRLNRDEFDVVVVSFSTKGALGPELERLGIPVIARRSGEGFSAGEAKQTWYNRFVLSLPVSWRNAVKPVKRAIRYVFGLPPVKWTLGKIGQAVYIASVTAWVGRTFRAERVEIAHFFLPHSYSYGMFACAFWRPRAKTVMSRLSLNFYKESHRLIAWLERNILHGRVDIAIGNSQMILDELAEEGVDPAKLRLLHNGIDPAPFVRTPERRETAREALGIAQDAFTVVAVGNLHAYKGHRDLIEACASVADHLPEGWRVLVGGRDEQGNRAVYEGFVAELGLAAHITFLGACGDVPQLLLAGDVFVQPSHHEGLPNAIIEAMAASLPVIGTRVGGIPEAVLALSAGASVAEETGWLVPPSDPDALAMALLEAAADAERRARMGERARARVETQFSLDKSVATYEAIYRELVPRAGA